jgi:hypothetical protein
MYLTDSDTLISEEEEAATMGNGLAGAGDVNGDGYDDFLIGLPTFSSNTQTSVGAAYLLLGSASKIPDMSLAGADAELVGEVAFDYVGDSVAGPGDVNGDGFNDILVGAYEHDGGEYNAGAAFLVLGSSLGVPNMTLDEAEAKLNGVGANDRAGYSLSGAGDINGDGYDDLLVGADGESTVGDNAGAAYLVLGSEL